MEDKMAAGGLGALGIIVETALLNGIFKSELIDVRHSCCHVINELS